MVPVNFHQLYYFWTAAKSGSITAAARRLYLRQSTLSLQIKQLEKSLGCRLLDRGRHGVALTEHGRAVFDHCGAIFSRAERMMAELGAEAPMQAPLRMGASRSVSRERVVSAIRSAWSVRGRPALRIFAGSNAELWERLEARQLDAALVDIDPSPRLGRTYRSRLLVRTPLYFVGTREVARRVGRFPKGLANVPLLARGFDHPIRRELDAFLQRHELAPELRAEVDDSDLLRMLALRGDGAALFAREKVASELAARRLVRLNRRPIGIDESLWVVAPVEPGVSGPARAAIERLLSGA